MIQLPSDYDCGVPWQSHSKLHNETVVDTRVCYR